LTGKIAWCVTGGGHLLKECVDLLEELADADLYVSPAGVEVMKMYGISPPVEPVTDASRSTVACRSLSSGVYRLLVVAPATSNSVAKFVCGISDTMITTLFAQAGKCRVPIVVLPTDVKETVETFGLTKPLKIHPRPVDLCNVEKLADFPGVTVAGNMEELKSAIDSAAPSGG